MRRGPGLGAVSARRVAIALLPALLSACAERPPRYDVPPPSAAPRFIVEVTVRGRPDLITPMGLAAGVVGGALAGGSQACLWSLGVVCAAAPVVMPLTAAAGLAIAETPGDITRAKRGLQQQDVTERVGPCLLDAIVAVGNARKGYRFVPADAASGAPRSQHIAVRVEPRAVGLTQGRGGEVFTLRAAARLDKQDLAELESSSSGRELGQWLMDGGKNIDMAMHEACTYIAAQLVSQVLAGR